MAKLKPPTTTEISERLLAIKMMIVGLKGALPTAAGELRRAACEDIDDLIEELAR